MVTRTKSRPGRKRRAAPPAARSRGELYAALDLGSNSFHMVLGRFAGGELRLLARHREQVQLAAGIRKDGRLAPAARERALACLGRFGQILSHVPSVRVRAVGTNALRVARDARSFLARAHEALGHPIEIVSGREEARLIYLGVVRTLAGDFGRRLVVDIGGGSTELIVGDGTEPVEAESLYMGCLSWTDQFFPAGRLDRESFRKATLTARAELQRVERRIRAAGWERSIGSSGTAEAVGGVLRATAGSDGAITRDGLKWVRREMVAAGSVGRLSLPGMRRERAPILPAGVALLEAVFEALAIDRMEVSPGALREGLLADLVGRTRHQDVRDQTISRFAQRFSVDRAHAARVAGTALAAFDGVADPWGLDRSEDRPMLAWAARLHEAGLAVSHSGYHRHGAYLLANADLPGFSRDEQAILATLVRTHRRPPEPALFDAVPDDRRAAVVRLCVLLRLGVLLHRSRDPKPLPALEVEGRRRSVVVDFPGDWLARHPLTRRDLDGEGAALALLGLRLRVTAAGRPVRSDGRLP